MSTPNPASMPKRMAVPDETLDMTASGLLGRAKECAMNAYVLMKRTTPSDNSDAARGQRYAAYTWARTGELFLKLHDHERSERAMAELEAEAERLERATGEGINATPEQPTVTVWLVGSPRPPMNIHRGEQWGSIADRTIAESSGLLGFMVANEVQSRDKWEMRDHNGNPLQWTDLARPGFVYLDRKPGVGD